MPRLTALRLPAVLGLLGALLAPAMPAVATESASIGAPGADLVSVQSTSDGGLGLGLKSAPEAIAVDPAAVAVDVPGTLPVAAHLSAADLVLPADAVPAGPVSIELLDVTGPGRVQVTEPGTAAVLLDSEGGRVATVDAGQRRATEWSFSAAGEYTVTFQASVPVNRTVTVETPAPPAPEVPAPEMPAPDAPAEPAPEAPVEPAPVEAAPEVAPAMAVTTQTLTETLASAPAVYTFRVAASTAVEPSPVPVETSRHAHGSTTAAGATVLNEGEVALEWAGSPGAGTYANRLSYVADGELRHVEADAAILQLTPQTLTQISAGYEVLGAAGQPAWITPGIPTPGALQFGWSSEHLAEGNGEDGIEVYWNVSSGPGTWGVFDRSARLLLSPAATGHERVTVPDDVFQPLALGFAAEGLYCVSLSHQFMLDDGRQHSGGVRLRVAVGDLDLSQIPPRGCDPSEDPGLGVPNGTVNDAGAVVLNAGSVDLSSALEGGGLTTSVRDWADGGESIREPRDVLLNVTSDPMVVDPELAAIYPWLGVPGSTSRIIDPNGEFVLGWTAERVPAAAIEGPIRWELTRTAGPGAVALVKPGFDENWNETFDVLFDGVGDVTTIDPGDAAAGLWVFNGDGVYCLGFTQTARLVGGATTSVESVLAFAVGDVDVMTVDPEECFADWNVDNGSTTRSGATILNVGHIDVASRLSAGALETVIKTDEQPPAYLDPARVVMQAVPASYYDVDSALRDWAPFLDGSVTGLYILPEVQQEGILWAGWSTELIESGATVGGVQWTITDIEGPGELYVFDSGNSLMARSIFNSADGLPDSYPLSAGTHQHGSWAFTEPGVYCVASTRTATLANGQTVSSRATLTFGVGAIDIRGVDPGECFDSAPDRDDTPATELAERPSDEFSLVGGSTVTAGSTVTVHFADDHSGRWLSPWLHSDPHWFGWTRVQADNRLAVTIPAGAPPGIHRVVIKDAQGGVLGWRPITVAAPAPPPPPAPPVSSTPASQCVAGATILSAGHVDYATRLVDGRLQSVIKDGTSATTVWREPSGTVLWLKPSARITSQGGAWSFLGAAGATAWNAPQTQNPDLIWLGWNTQELGAAQVAGPVRWSLDRVDGPGAVTIYTIGSFGNPTVLMQNGGSMSVPLGTHAHGNWGFTAEGVYRLTLTQTATLAGGAVSSDTETLTIAVGDVDPASAVSGGSGCEPLADSIAPDALAAVATDPAAGAQDRRDDDTVTARDAEADPLLEQLSSPAVLAPVLLGLLLLIGGAATWWYVRRRRA